MADVLTLTRRVERLEAILLQMAIEIRHFEDPRGYMIADVISNAVFDNPLDTEGDTLTRELLKRL